MKSIRFLSNFTAEKNQNFDNTDRNDASDVSYVYSSSWLSF